MTLANYETYRGNDRQTAATSTHAMRVSNVIRCEIIRFSSSAMGSKFVDVKNAIEKSWIDASQAEWDGPNSVPVSEKTYHKALDFISSFSLVFNQKPSVNPEAEGGIGFDWENENGDSFTVVVREQRLVFSSIMSNGDKERGVVRMRDGKLPPGILVVLSQMFPKR